MRHGVARDLLVYLPNMGVKIISYLTKSTLRRQAQLFLHIVPPYCPYI